MCVLAHFVSRLERRALVMATASVNCFMYSCIVWELCLSVLGVQEWGIFEGEFLYLCSEFSSLFPELFLIFKLRPFAFVPLPVFIRQRDLVATFTPLACFECHQALINLPAG